MRTLCCDGRAERYEHLLISQLVFDECLLGEEKRREESKCETADKLEDNKRKACFHSNDLPHL